MKLTPTKIKECAQWVEKHGLQPQACGALVKDFCAAMGFSYKSYERWQENDEFVDAINAARAKFKARTVLDIENGLFRAATGIEAEITKEKANAIDDVIREYDPVTGKLIRETKTKKLVTVEAVRERRYFTPDVKAAIFALTNMAPDKWSNTQDVTLGVNGTEPGGLGIRIIDTRKHEHEHPSLAPEHPEDAAPKLENK